jgi:hypothetical protein
LFGKVIKQYFWYQTLGISPSHAGSYKTSFKKGTLRESTMRRLLVKLGYEDDTILQEKENPQKRTPTVSKKSLHEQFGEATQEKMWYKPIGMKPQQAYNYKNAYNKGTLSKRIMKRILSQLKHVQKLSSKPSTEIDLSNRMSLNELFTKVTDQPLWYKKADMDAKDATYCKARFRQGRLSKELMIEILWMVGYVRNGARWVKEKRD